MTFTSQRDTDTVKLNQPVIDYKSFGLKATVRTHTDQIHCSTCTTIQWSVQCFPRLWRTLRYDVFSLFVELFALSGRFDLEWSHSSAL